LQNDSSQRVTRQNVQRAGSSSSTGIGTYSYSYFVSGNAAGTNSWQVKTTETLPDGNTNIVYTNSYGEPMLMDHHDASTSQDWNEFTEYDSQGRPILTADPVAVPSYNDVYSDLLNNVGGKYQYLS